MTRVTMLLAAGLVLLAATTLPAMRAVAQEDHVVTDANLNEKVKNAKTTAGPGSPISASASSPLASRQLPIAF